MAHELDPSEVDDFSRKFPNLPRSRVEMVVECYGPSKVAIESALLQLAAAQEVRTARSERKPLT